MDGWKGIGWFRLHLKVDSTLLGEPMGIRVRYFGDSEIYLDGKLLFEYGTVDRNSQEEKRFYPQYPQAVTFSGENHVIAVRYSNHSLVKINDSSITATATGMPPILIYRDHERKVEELTIKQLPLGGDRSFRISRDQARNQTGRYNFVDDRWIPGAFQ